MSRPEDGHSEHARNHYRFRRWDIVVLLLLGILVLGMLIPSVSRIQVGGHRTYCQNNIRQIGLALLAAHSSQERLPPFFGPLNKKPDFVTNAKGPTVYSATLFYHLLPHLEQAGTYQRLPPLFDFPEAGHYVLAPNAPLIGQGMPDENAAMFKVPSYICPSDSTGDPSGLQVLSLAPGRGQTSVWGANTYAANYLLFGLVKDARLPESVPDGLSTTIFFTEKAMACSDAESGRGGGNLWAVPAFFPSDPKATVNYGGTVGYDPADANPDKPYSLGLFQVQPASGKCDPSLAQSPHSGGINVSMGDGSARFVSGTVSAKTWSALLTPYPVGGGRSDTPGSDWQ